MTRWSAPGSVRVAVAKASTVCGPAATRSAMPSSAATDSDCAAAKPKPIRRSVARVGSEGGCAARFAPPPFAKRLVSDGVVRTGMGLLPVSHGARSIVLSASGKQQAVHITERPNPTPCGAPLQVARANWLCHRSTRVRRSRACFFQALVSRSTFPVSPSAPGR